MDNSTFSQEMLDKKNMQFEELFQVVAFFLNNKLFALDVMNIRDIIMAKTIFTLPNTNNALLGVINLRGEILPTYSLKKLIEMKENIHGMISIEQKFLEDKYIIIIQHEKKSLGLLVDQIFRTVSATNLNYHTSANLEKWSQNYMFSGILSLPEEERELLCIHVPNLLHFIINKK